MCVYDPRTGKARAGGSWKLADQLGQPKWQVRGPVREPASENKVEPSIVAHAF